jgi:MurNAc alpha-1-phosphate uridylyltransferase
MLEVMSYLRANGFKTFIVSGGGVEFMRAFAEETYGIPPEQVVGSSGVVRFELREGKPVLVKDPKIEFVDDGPGKPAGINRFIGRRPVMAFGNSDGDLQMLQWTTAGDGARFGLSVAYSREGRDHGGALETAGGIAKALPLLGDAFWIVSADVWAPDFRFGAAAAARFVESGRLARLWLVPNPVFHPRGDFGLDADGLGLAEGTGPDGQRWTYANIALLRAEMFAGIAPGTSARLAPLLYAGMRERRIGAEVWRGRWENVGTPEQLAALNAARPSPRRGEGD